jgi:hypothetical protein
LCLVVAFNATLSHSHVTDCLGICYGFTVASELASQVGAERTWSGDNGGWLVQHDHWYRTSVNGVSAATDQTGVHCPIACSKP